MFVDHTPPLPLSIVVISLVPLHSVSWSLSINPVPNELGIALFYHLVFRLIFSPSLIPNPHKTPYHNEPGFEVERRHGDVAKYEILGNRKIKSLYFVFMSFINFI